MKKLIYFIFIFRKEPQRVKHGGAPIERVSEQPGQYKQYRLVRQEVCSSHPVRFHAVRHFCGHDHPTAYLIWSYQLVIR